MQKVNILYEIGLEYLFDEKSETPKASPSKLKPKLIQVSDKVFDMMVSEGLIRKTTDGYVFVGKKTDLTDK